MKTFLRKILSTNVRVALIIAACIGMGAATHNAEYIGDLFLHPADHTFTGDVDFTGASVTGLGGGGGGVTSVQASGGTTGLSFSGGPITTSGTLTLAGALVAANGGVPSGGTAAYVLTKNSGTSYDYSWAAAAGGSMSIGGAVTGSGTTAGYMLTTNASSNLAQENKFKVTYDATFDGGNGKTYVSINPGYNAGRYIDFDFYPQPSAGTAGISVDGNSMYIRAGGSQVLDIKNSNQVGINTGGTIAASAKLQVNSTDAGFLGPRMTKAQRNAISSPADGLMIIQTDNTPGLRVHYGGTWVRFTETADP